MADDAGVTIETVTDYFSKFGKVLSVRLRRDQDKSFKGKAYVEFNTVSEAEAAAKDKNQVWGEKPIETFTKCVSLFFFFFFFDVFMPLVGVNILRLERRRPRLQRKRKSASAKMVARRTRATRRISSSQALCLSSKEFLRPRSATLLRHIFTLTPCKSQLTRMLGHPLGCWPYSLCRLPWQGPRHCFCSIYYH